MKNRRSSIENTVTSRVVRGNHDPFAAQPSEHHHQNDENQGEEQPLLTEEEREIVQDFYDDNEERYATDNEEDFVDVVPVLPIKVPEHLKAEIMRKVEAARAEAAAKENANASKQVHDDAEDSKRPYKRFLSAVAGLKRSNDGSHESHDKKQKTASGAYSLYKSGTEASTASGAPEPDALIARDAPAIVLETTVEAKKADLDEETRVREAMMGTTQALREDQWNDPMLCAEYASEIFGNLYIAEVDTLADPNYANNHQHALTWAMRAVLIDWIIEMHYLFGLLPETFFLAINIIDRFLSMRSVALGKLQLVGITALLIATKFEEITCPRLQDFLKMTDDAVSEDDMIKAERFVLQNLDFRLLYSNPLNFLRRICTEELETDMHTRTLAKYYMEVTAIDHRFIGVRPSKIAAASLWLSRKMLGKGKWTAKFTQRTGYSAADLKPIVETLLDYLSSPIIHDALFKKWSSKKLCKASVFVRDWVNKYYLNDE